MRAEQRRAFCLKLPVRAWRALGSRYASETTSLVAERYHRNLRPRYSAWSSAHYAQESPGPPSRKPAATLSSPALFTVRSVRKIEAATLTPVDALCKTPGASATKPTPKSASTKQQPATFAVSGNRNSAELPKTRRLYCGTVSKPRMRRGPEHSSASLCVERGSPRPIEAWLRSALTHWHLLRSGLKSRCPEVECTRPPLRNTPLEVMAAPSDPRTPPVHHASTWRAEPVQAAVPCCETRRVGDAVKHRKADRSIAPYHARLQTQGADPGVEPITRCFAVSLDARVHRARREATNLVERAAEPARDPVSEMRADKSDRQAASNAYERDRLVRSCCR